MTDPISLDGPTPVDVESTERLRILLRDEFHLFESEAESQHREEVLGRLDHIAKEWVKAVSIKKVRPSPCTTLDPKSSAVPNSTQETRSLPMRRACRSRWQPRRELKSSHSVPTVLVSVAQVRVPLVVGAVMVGLLWIDVAAFALQLYSG
jgi:hypothetical protein